MNYVNEFHPGFEKVKREIEYFLDGSLYNSALFKTFYESETSSMDLLRNYRMFYMEYFRTFRQLYNVYPRCILESLIEKLSKLDLIFEEFSHEQKNSPRCPIEEVYDHAKCLLNLNDETIKEYAKKMLNPKDEKEYEESVKIVTDDMWRVRYSMAVYYTKWDHVLNWRSFRGIPEEEYFNDVDSLLLEILEKSENMETICEAVPKELLFPLIVIMIHGALVMMRRCSIKEAFLNSFDDVLTSIYGVVFSWSRIKLEEDEEDEDEEDEEDGEDGEDGEDVMYREYIRLADLDSKYNTKSFNRLKQLLSYGEHYSKCYELKENPDHWLKLLFK